MIDCIVTVGKELLPKFLSGWNELVMLVENVLN